MFLDENSSRDEILKDIKMYSFNFLRNFSHKPWAQPYIDETVREVAKRKPKYFLENLADRFPDHINFALFELRDENETI